MGEKTDTFDSNNIDSPLGKMEIEDIRKEVKGKTLQVYLLLAKTDDLDFGVREISQKLNFSSVSLAAYHLNKLESINLVKKTSNNRYKVSKLLPLGSYEDFFVLKGKYLPKEAFFLTFSTSSLLLAILGTIYSWMRFRTIYRRKDEEVAK